MLLHICWISNKQPLAYTQNDFKGDNMPILCLQLLHLPPSGRKIIIVALNNTKYLKSVCISVALRYIKCNGKTCQQKACSYRLLPTVPYVSFYLSLSLEETSKTLFSTIV